MHQSHKLSPKLINKYGKYLFCDVADYSELALEILDKLEHNSLEIMEYASMLGEQIDLIFCKSTESIFDS